VNTDKNINEYMTKGRVEKARSGSYSGGRIPYGYSVSDGKLVIEKAEACVVRMIFAMRESGGTYKGIAEKLKDMGIVSRGGKPMIFTTVKSILGNRKTYEGYYRYGEMEWVKGEHEAILR
jgi:site-specific DNA recombinase